MVSNTTNKYYLGRYAIALYYGGKLGKNDEWCYGCWDNPTVAARELGIPRNCIFRAISKGLNIFVNKPKKLRCSIHLIDMWDNNDDIR